ncbi:MAG: YhcH/YjgK/YiaL family protein [Bacteroidales bacterium]
MILDSLQNSASVESLHPNFKKAFDYIRNNDLANIEAGKIVLDGDNLFITIADITGKEASAARMEAHRNYIDIQIPLTGVETMGYLPLASCNSIETPFNEEKDIIFFNDKPSTYLNVAPGQFAIFFPEDGHAPGIGQGAMRKLIVKVKI